jgi:PAS domain S-box-containing protein
MESNENKENRFLTALPQVFGLVAASIGLLALLGWIFQFPLLASFGANLIPMAPSTALLFIMLGAILFLRNRLPQNRKMYFMGMTIGSLVTVTALLLFFSSYAGIYPQIEHVGFSLVETFEGVPIGHMSLVTAICFVFVGLSWLALLSSSAERTKRAKVAFGLACLIILISLTLFLTYFFERPFLYGGSLVPPALSTSLAFFLLGIALSLISGPQFIPLSRLKEAATTRTSYVLFLIFIIMTISIMAIGYYYYRHYEQQYRLEIERQLSAIAELKTDELVHYRNDRFSDASILYKNASFSFLVRRFFIAPNNPEIKNQLQDWLGKYQFHYRYDRVFLLDARRIERLSIPEAREPIAAMISQRSAEILRSREIYFEDFYRNEHNNKIYLTILVPVLDETDSSRVLGIVGFNINPEDYLYLLINRWPAPSQTAEAILVRRDGNNALFLNELRFQKNTALTLQSPLTNVNMPAVKAVLGTKGSVEGIDHRGVPVLANVRHIPGSPWFLVVRMDISEIYAPMRERAWQMIFSIIILLIGTGAGVGLVWRNQRVRFYREKFQAAEALRITEEKYRRLIEVLPDGVVVHSEGRIIYANPSTAKIIGAESPEKLIGTPVMDFVHPDDREIVMNRIKQSLSEGSVAPTTEERFIRLDGTLLTAEVSGVPISYGDKQAMLTVINDITERKRAEEALRESEASLKEAQSLGKIGNWAYDIQKQTIVWSDQTYILYERDVKLGPPSLEEEAQYYSVEQATLLRDYAAISVDTRQSLSYDMEVKLSSGKTVHFHSIMYPVEDTHGRVVKLIGTVQDITERKLAEKALRSSEQRYRTTIETAPDVIYALDAASGNITMLNPAFKTVTGWSPNEWIGKNFASLVHPEDLQLATDTFQRVLRGESPPLYELRILTRSGEYVVGEFTSVPQLEGEKIVGEFGIARDITERKRAEESLKKEKMLSDSIIENMPAGIAFLDNDFVLRKCNRAYEALIYTYTPYSPEQALGMSYFE